MGNTPITIGLRTEKLSYRAGERVNGTVYVSVNHRKGGHEPVQAILLRLEGQERAVVHYTSTETEGDQSRSRDHYDESNVTFSKMEHPLQTVPSGKIGRGQYEYPFSIQLPHSLPSSMECQSGQSHCSVEYKLTATFIKPPSSSGLFSSHPSSEQKLTIRAEPNPMDDNDLANTSLVLPVRDVPVIACCCDNKGAMLLQAKFDKTTAKPHDSISVQFRCQNESSVKVKKVQVEFESIITWKGCHGSQKKRVRHVLDSQIMDASKFPELKKHRPGHATTHNPRRTPDPPAPTPYDIDGSFPYDNVPWRQALIRVPGMVYDSYEGHAVHVRHNMTVTLSTKGCCINDVDASTLIQLFQNLPSNANTTTGRRRPPHQEGSNHNNNNNNTAAPVPSAPSDVYNEYAHVAAAAAAASNVSPSAPPHWKDDDNDSSYVHPLGPPQAGYNSSVPTATATAMAVSPTHVTTATATMVHAQALPPDWNAHTAQVVEIPMAEAWIVENVWQASETRDGQ